MPFLSFFVDKLIYKLRFLREPNQEFLSQSAHTRMVGTAPLGVLVLVLVQGWVGQELP